MAGGDEALEAIRQDLEIRIRNPARWNWGSHDVTLLGFYVVLRRGKRSNLTLLEARTSAGQLRSQSVLK